MPLQTSVEPVGILTMSKHVLRISMVAEVWREIKSVKSVSDILPCATIAFARKRNVAQGSDSVSRTSDTQLWAWIVPVWAINGTD
jgi:hypothetical protein